MIKLRNKKITRIYPSNAQLKLFLKLKQRSSLFFRPPPIWTGCNYCNYCDNPTNLKISQLFH